MSIDSDPMDVDSNKRKSEEDHQEVSPSKKSRAGTPTKPLAKQTPVDETPVIQTPTKPATPASPKQPPSGYAMGLAGYAALRRTSLKFAEDVEKVKAAISPRAMKMGKQVIHDASRAQEVLQANYAQKVEPLLTSATQAAEARFPQCPPIILRTGIVIAAVLGTVLCLSLLTTLGGALVGQGSGAQGNGGLGGGSRGKLHQQHKDINPSMPLCTGSITDWFGCTSTADMQRHEQEEAARKAKTAKEERIADAKEDVEGATKLADEAAKKALEAKKEAQKAREAAAAAEAEAEKNAQEAAKAAEEKKNAQEASEAEKKAQEAQEAARKAAAEAQKSEEEARLAQEKLDQANKLKDHFQAKAEEAQAPDDKLNAQEDATTTTTQGVLQTPFLARALEYARPLPQIAAAAFFAVAARNAAARAGIQNAQKLVDDDLIAAVIAVVIYAVPTGFAAEYAASKFAYAWESLTGYKGYDWMPISPTVSVVVSSICAFQHAQGLAYDPTFNPLGRVFSAIGGLSVGFGMQVWAGFNWGSAAGLPAPAACPRWDLAC